MAERMEGEKISRFTRELKLVCDAIETCAADGYLHIIMSKWSPEHGIVQYAVCVCVCVCVCACVRVCVVCEVLTICR